MFVLTHCLIHQVKNIPEESKVFMQKSDQKLRMLLLRLQRYNGINVRWKSVLEQKSEQGVIQTIDFFFSKNHLGQCRRSIKQSYILCEIFKSHDENSFVHTFALFHRFLHIRMGVYCDLNKQVNNNLRQKKTELNVLSDTEMLSVIFYFVLKGRDNCCLSKNHITAFPPLFDC